MRPIITHNADFRIISYFLVFLILNLPVALFAQQQLPGTAPVTIPSNGFAIDGSVHRLGTPGDWRPTYPVNSPTAGTFILNRISVTGGFSAEPVYADNSTAFIKDAYNSTSDKIFTTGSKFNMGVGVGSDKLQWGTGKATGKNDINNGMFYIGLAANGDRWLIMGGDRYSVQGTSYIDFEFLQRELIVDPGGTFSYAPDPQVDPPPAVVNGKTPKDFVLSIAYTKGGSTVGVYLYVWQNDGTYKLETIPSGIAYAKTNEVDIPVDITAFGNSTYEAYAFVEAAVNITELYKQVIGGGYSDCEGAVYQSMFIKTKASDAMDAALKDFIEPQSIDLSFDGPSISYSAPSFCIADLPQSVTITGGTPTTKSFSSSPAGLVDANTGEILAGASAGTYTVTMNYTISGCNGSTQTTVVIKPTPTITPGTIGDVCVGSTSISIPYSGATSGATYSLDFNNPPFTDVNNAALPGSPISYTIPGNLGAGTYNGTITVTKDGCSSTPQQISFTVGDLTVTGQSTNGSCVEGQPTNNGSITITISAGTPAYTAVWTKNGAAYATQNNLTYPLGESEVETGLTGLSAGTYTVVVTDNKTGSACQKTLGYVISVPNAPPSPTYQTVDPSLCSATPDGQIIILTPGAGYSYMLKTGATPGTYEPWLDLDAIGANRGYTGLAGNSYTLYVKDGNNCITSTPISCVAPVEEKSNSTAQAENRNSTYLGSAELKLGVTVKPMPNPFSNQVRFMIDASEGGMGTLELYNLQGQKVKTIFSGYIHAGSNYFDLKMTGQHSGQYMYVLRMGSEKVTGKLLRTN